MTTYFVKNIHNKLADIGKDPASQHTPSIVQGVKRCVRLAGTNKQICTVELEDGKDGFISTSADIKIQPNLRKSFRLNYCDPTEEICDIPSNIFSDINSP